MEPQPTRATPLFRFDPGWPYVIAGLGLLVAAVLIPAQRELHRLENSLAMHQALERQAVRQLGAYDRFLADLEHGDPQLVKRLAASQLNLMPEGQSALMLQPSANETVTDWIMQSEPAELPTPAAYPDTLLTRLATGPRRLWVLACGVFLVFIGLLLGPSSPSRGRRAPLGAGAIGGTGSGATPTADPDASSDEHRGAAVAVAALAGMGAARISEPTAADAIAERLAAAGVTDESVSCVSEATVASDGAPEVPAPRLGLDAADEQAPESAFEVAASAAMPESDAPAPSVHPSLVEPKQLECVSVAPSATEATLLAASVESEEHSVEAGHLGAVGSEVDEVAAEPVRDVAEVDPLIAEAPEALVSAEFTLDRAASGISGDEEAISVETDASGVASAEAMVAASDVAEDDAEHEVEDDDGAEDDDASDSDDDGEDPVHELSIESDGEVTLPSDEFDVGETVGDDEPGIDIARAGTPVLEESPELADAIDLPSEFDRALDSLTLFHGLPDDRWLDTRDPRIARG